MISIFLFICTFKFLYKTYFTRRSQATLKMCAITIDFERLLCFSLSLSLFYFFFLIYIFYWRIIALQNFVVFCQTSTWISHRYTYVPSLLNLAAQPNPLGWYRAPVLSFLSHTVNSHWLSTLHIVCKFPCYSFHTSHPLLQIAIVHG